MSNATSPLDHIRDVAQKAAREDAIAKIDAKLGAGFAEKVPGLIEAFLQNAASEGLPLVLARAAEHELPDAPYRASP